MHVFVFAWIIGAFSQISLPLQLVAEHPLWACGLEK